MSNPFIKSIPQDYSIRRGPLPQVPSNITTIPTTANYPMAATAFNSESTYFSSGSGPSVTSLNTLQNAVTISSTNGNLTVAEVGNDIQLTVLAGGIGVEDLNNLEGSVTISSTNGNLTVAEVSNDIQLTVNAGGAVNSLQYNNPLGTFAGSPNLIVTDEGGSVGSKVSNATGINSICLDRGSAFANGASFQSNTSSISILANTSMTVGGDSSLRCGAGASAYGTVGQVLTAVGDTTCIWATPPPPPSGGVTSLNLNTGAITIVGTGTPNDVIVSGLGVNPIVVSAPSIAVAISDAAAAQATANTAQTTANTAQTTANTAITNAAAASAAAAAASAAAAIADATAISAGAAAATANAGVATILSSYVTQITAGTGISVSGGTGNVTINAPVYQSTYYNSVAQNLTNGNTDITFDLTGAWNNPNGYITHVSGTKDFTVVQTGLYQLEFNATILLNNGTWSPTISRGIYIDITRPSIAEQNIIGNTSLQAIANYNMQTSATFYLIAGDVINLRINNPYTLGTPTPPQAQGITNTFDLNTFFSWRFIS